MGFVRDVMSVAGYLGPAAAAEAFLSGFAFSLPNMFRPLFAEGAAFDNETFCAMFSKKLESGDDTRKIRGAGTPCVGWRSF